MKYECNKVNMYMIFKVIKVQVTSKCVLRKAHLIDCAPTKVLSVLFTIQLAAIILLTMQNVFNRTTLVILKRDFSFFKK